MIYSEKILSLIYVIKVSLMKFRLIVISVFAFLLFSVSTYANWHRLVSNYTRHDYQAANQNWMIAQHENGWMYFANNKGLLEFDGVEWNTYPIRNAKTRSVRVGNDNRIYIGGMGQFGYFEPNYVGELEYVCLSDILLEDINVGIIWNIHVADDRVYFQSDWHIFYLQDGMIKSIKAESEIMHSAIINNKFYIASRQGLSVLSGDELSLITPFNQPFTAKVVALLPFGEKILMVTDRVGLYTFDGASLKYYTSAGETFIRSNQLFCAAIRDSVLALGSVQDGLLLLNHRTGETEKITITNGLQNKTILSLAFDRESNLWLGLDNGIDYIRLNSPVFSLFGNKSIIGSGYTSSLYKGMLYLGTNQGLYKTSEPIRPTQEVEINFVSKTEGQIWSLLNYNNQLFCAGDNGLFVLEDYYVYKVEGIRGVWSVTPLSAYPDVLIAATYNGLHVIRKVGDKWKYEHKVEGFSYSCKDVFPEAHTNAFWVASKQHGVFRIVISDDLVTAMKVKLYNNESFPVGYDSYITSFQNNIVVTSHWGLFKYNQIKDCLEKYDELEKLLNGNTAYTHLFCDKFGNIWYTTGGSLRILPYNHDIEDYERNNARSYLKGSMIANFEDIYVSDNHQAVIGTEEGFTLLDLGRQPQQRVPLNLQIRKVYITGGGKDSLIYGQSFVPNNEALVIPYQNNSLRMEYSVNNYSDPVSTLYSYKLSGEHEENWSEYTANNVKEYTNLKEGKYIFDVRMLTDRMQEPVYTSFSFEILPPWYRTWWAYLSYLIVILLFLYYLYCKMVRSQKLLVRQKEFEIERQQKEFRREYEKKDKKIETLKEENLKAELQHKSDELIRTTINIVRKNEMLQDIRKEAISISNSINEENLVNIRRKTLRLISRIDTNIEHDEDLKNFQRTFDSVHYDFFKRLDDQFPDLHHKEKMLCAYIKMNLMSKEIAPLLNISVRGVEISRYRLRKKLKLGEKDNLADFLQRMS